MRAVIYVPCTQLVSASNMSDKSDTTGSLWSVPQRYLFGAAQVLQLFALIMLIMVHADNRLVMYEEETIITVKAITYRIGDVGNKCALPCDKANSGYCPDSGFIGGSSECSSESDPGIEIMPEVVYRYTQGIKAGGDLVTNTEIKITHASTTDDNVLAIANSLDPPFALEATMSADYRSLCLPEPGDVSTYNNMAMVLPMGEGGLISAGRDTDVNTTLREAGCLRVGVIAKKSGKTAFAVCVFADDRAGDTSYQRVNRTHVYDSIVYLMSLNDEDSALVAFKLGLEAGGNKTDGNFDPLQSRYKLWGKQQLLGKVCQWSRIAVDHENQNLALDDYTFVSDDDAALLRFAYFGASEHYREHLMHAFGGSGASAIYSTDGAPVPCRWSLLPVTLPLVSSRFASRMVASPRPAHGLYETPYGGVVSPSAGGCGALRPPIAWGVNFNESTATEKHDCAHECAKKQGQISAGFWPIIIIGIVLFALSTFMLMLLYRQVYAADSRMLSGLKVLLFVVCVAGPVYIAYTCVEELIVQYETHAKCAFENVAGYIESTPQHYDSSQGAVSSRVGPRMLKAIFGMYVAVATFYVVLAGISLVRSYKMDSGYFLVQSNLF